MVKLSKGHWEKRKKWMNHKMNEKENGKHKKNTKRTENQKPTMKTEKSPAFPTPPKKS